MVSWGQPGLDPAADLEKLGAELGASDCRTTLVTRQDRGPWLYVTRCRDGQTAAVAADGAYFRWPDSQRPIAPVTRPGAAAAAIAAALQLPAPAGA